MRKVENLLPECSLSQVRQVVPIYLDLATYDYGETAVYHSKKSLGWLIERGEPPEKLGSINILDARKFCELVQPSGYYPASFLHEVAHAFHDRILDQGFDNLRVREAYDNAMAQGKYRNVVHVNGKVHDSNASKNHEEYFANNTTAFFDRNDAYPFNKNELSNYDPDVAALMRECWAV